jgi:predicted negative regulator of RcsB-dependent stress response
MRELYMYGENIFASIIAIYNIATLNELNLIVGLVLGVLMIGWKVWQYIDKIKERRKK